MARPNLPTLPDDKLHYYREQLYRELSHMFKWEGLPQTVPEDYLERELVRGGFVLFYEDEVIGHDVLACQVTGYNRHNMPVSAQTFTPNTIGEKTTVFRKLKRLSDSKDAIDEFDPLTDGVLIRNMEYGQSAKQIVDHFSYRLALSQQAFDTNLLWANVPYIFQTSSDDTRLSIERMFNQIFTGRPFIINDPALFADNKDRTGLPGGMDFIAKDLMDVQNEIMMTFRQTVGFDTAGVDKAERVNTMEIQSNNQHTRSVVEIMLQQRQIAVDNINAFFGTNITVGLLHDENYNLSEEDEEEDGTDNSGVETSTGIE